MCRKWYVEGEPVLQASRKVVPERARKGHGLGGQLANFDRTPGYDAWFLACQFPRTYTDPNRGLVDLDPAMIEGGWPDPVEVTKKTHRAISLIWKLVDDEHEFYDRLLSQAEVQNCIVVKLAD